MSEEVLNFILGLLRHVVDVLNVSPALVFDWHTQDFFVDAAIVFHRQNTDRANLDDHAWEHRELEQNQSVKRVAVAAQSVVEIAVIDRVNKRCEKHAVEANAARLVVNLIFVAAAARNLDDGVNRHGAPK